MCRYLEDKHGVKGKHVQPHSIVPLSDIVIGIKLALSCVGNPNNPNKPLMIMITI